MKAVSTVVPPRPQANTPQQSNVSLCWGQCGEVGVALTRSWGRAVLSLAEARIHQGLSFRSAKREETSSLGTRDILQSCPRHWGPRPPSVLEEETSVTPQEVFFSEVRSEGSMWSTSHATAELSFQRGLRSRYSLSR